MGDTPPRIVGHRHFTPEERAAFQAGVIGALSGAIIDVIDYRTILDEEDIRLIHDMAKAIFRRRIGLPYKVQEQLFAPTFEIQRRTEDENKDVDERDIRRYAGQIAETIRLAVNDSNLC